MTLKVGIIMDPIQNMQYQKDSTLAMCWEAEHRDWTLFHILAEDLYLENESCYANAQALTTYQDPKKWYRLAQKQQMAIDTFDVLLMRKDPPFDMTYVHATYFLEKAQEQGVLVVNNPKSLRDHNEKLLALKFPNCCTDTLVSSQPGPIQDFSKQHGDIILKPLDGMGGRGIFKVNASGENLSSCIELLTDHYRQPIMAQRFIPDISAGDKRILMVNGHPIPYALARIPKAGEIRGNLAAGGTGKGQPLSQRDQEIAETVGPFLRQEGILFAGLDVIGDYLTEVNITSPTCIRELDAQFNLNIARNLLDAIEKTL